MKKVGILYDMISGNTGDVAIGLSVRKILNTIGVDFDELVPGNFNPLDYETIIVGGGHLLRKSPDFYYDKFRVVGNHILNAAGIVDSPDDLHYLNDYKYITVRSEGDKRKLDYLKKEVHVVPCTTMCLEDLPDFQFPLESPSLGIHLIPFFAQEDEDKFVAWALSQPFTIYFLPITHYNKDIEYMRNLSKKIKNSKMIPILKADEIFTLVGRFDYFIGCSLHGAIFSYIHNVPFLLFSLNDKMDFFMEDRKLNRYSVKSIPGMIDAFEYLLYNKPDYSAQIELDKTTLTRHITRLKNILPANGVTSASQDATRVVQSNYQINSILLNNSDLENKVDTLQLLAQSREVLLRERNERLDGLAQTLQAKEEQLRSSNERLDGLAQTLQAREEQLRSSNERLDGLAQTLQAREEQLRGSNERLDGLTQTLQAKEEQLRDSNERLDGLTQTLQAKEEQLRDIQNREAYRDVVLQSKDGKIHELEKRAVTQTDDSEKVRQLKRENDAIKASFVYNLLMAFQHRFIDKFFPQGTEKRKAYESGIMRLRSLYVRKASDRGSIPDPAKKPILTIDISSKSNNIPIPLEKPVRGTFIYPCENLDEIRILTATYLRVNSDIVLNLRSDSARAPIIRSVRIPGRYIQDNNFTSFRFKPIGDSGQKRFYFELFSKGMPQAAVWYNPHHLSGNLQLCENSATIPGSLGFQCASAGISLDPYTVWVLNNELPPGNYSRLKEECEQFSYRPKISIITPVWNTDERWLRLAIDSVRNQIYENWELCLADGGSTKSSVRKILNEYAGTDSRIRVVFLDENMGIAKNSQEAYKLASGEYIGFLDHDDEMSPFALFEAVKVLNSNPGILYIYSDEDKIDETSARKDPFFKPEWSPDLFLSCNYLCHFSLVHKKIMEDIGGFRSGYDGSQDYDLFLRITERINPQEIAHIPKILYHWRMIPESASSSILAKPYAYESAKKAITASMLRKNVDIDGVEDGLWTGSYRVKYSIRSEPGISIIIPTRDNIDTLKCCILSILEKTDYQNYNIMIIDNNSSNPETFEYYRSLEKMDRIRILKYENPFNFSAINNFAVQSTESPYICFLNNDTEVISREWLSAMLEHAQRQEVGAVGALLHYPNNTIQHAGLIIGNPFIAINAHKHTPSGHNGYFGRSKEIQDVSAVTAACMMMKKETFTRMGGFDENLSVAYNDVDLCLRLRKAGYLIIFTPFAQLYHYESYTRGFEDTPEKLKRFQEETKIIRDRWDSIINEGDPYYSPNLTLEKEDFSIKI